MPKKAAPLRHLAPKRTAESSEDSIPKKVKSVTGRVLSSDLLAIVRPINERSTRNIPSKEELSLLLKAVRDEGKLSDELKAKIQRYININTASVAEKGLAQPVLQLADLYESCREDKDKLELLEKSMKVDDNQEIANLVANWLLNHSQNIQVPIKELFKGYEDNIAQRLKDLSDPSYKEGDKRQIDKIQATLAEDGRVLSKGKGKASFVAESEGSASASSAPRKAKAKPGKGRVLSSKLLAIVDPIYKRDSKKRPLKEELPDMVAAVEDEGNLSTELSKMLQHYGSSERALPDFPLELSDHYQSHMKDRKRLGKLELELKVVDNQEIASLLATFVRQAAETIQDKVKRRFKGFETNIQQRLEELHDPAYNEAEGSQLVSKIKAVLDGRMLETGNVTLDEILDGIQAKSKRVPVRDELRAMSDVLEAEGTEDWLDRALLAIIKEHADPTPFPAGLEPVDVAKHATQRAYEYKAQIISLDYMHEYLSPRKKRTVPFLKSSIAQAIRTLRRRIKDKDADAIVEKLMELANLETLGSDAARRAHRQVEKVKMFIAPSQQAQAKIFKALFLIDQSKTEIETYTEMWKGHHITSREELDFLKSRVRRVIDEHNALCQQFKDAYPEKAGEYKFTLEEMNGNEL